MNSPNPTECSQDDHRYFGLDEPDSKTKHSNPSDADDEDGTSAGYVRDSTTSEKEGGELNIVAEDSKSQGSFRKEGEGKRRGERRRAVRASGTV